jgi:hypothetical protein
LQEDGAQTRTHLQRAAEAGKVDPRLFNECPAGGLELWKAYAQIGRSRPAGFGAAPISQQEIEAWQRNYGVRLTPWELDTLIEIDNAFMGVLKKKKG